MKLVRLNFTVLIFCLSQPSVAQDAKSGLEQAFADVEPKVIEWRHDIHQNPELSNREFRTAALVAEHMRNLGFDNVEAVAKLDDARRLVVAGGSINVTTARRLVRDAQRRMQE